ncbi:MAG: carboxymuconolactone decarboxylase family protein [Amaricoccus sp.]
MRKTVMRTTTGAAILAGALAAAGGQALAQDTDAQANAAYAEIAKTMGGVPDFVKLFPKVGIAGAWAETRDLELSDKTALTPKEKSLISLAVAAQIPCQYCIWLDTVSARKAGATDEDIAEAVAMAALARHWSTVFNGLQIDFATFKQQMGSGQ